MLLNFKFALLGALLASSARRVDAHSVEVLSCVTTTDDLRVFIRHYHNTNVANAGDQTFRDNIAGTNHTLSPDGMINDVATLVSPWDDLRATGCSTPVVQRSACPSSFLTSNQRNFHWYDFPIACDGSFDVTVHSVEGVILQDWCGSLFPTTFIGNPTPPVVSVDGQECTSTSPIVINELTSDCDDQGTHVSFTLSASDDCDTSPSVTSAPTSGSFFPIGSSTVSVTTTDAVGNDDAVGNESTCTFTVNVSQDPNLGSCTTAPTSAPTSAPSTLAPTSAPTSAPSTLAPTSTPTSTPSSAPTSTPTSTPSSAPTSTPTSSPSSTPTSTPSSAPTSTPTSSPSSSPVIPSPGPWGIVHQGFSSDFTNSSQKDIASEYLIGKARNYETVLLDMDCEANITGIDITTTEVKTPLNDTFEHLMVQHDVNTSSIAESSAWNGTTNELEVCQIVRLFLPASESGGNGKMVLAEDIRQIKIGFEMTADFNITAGLAAATVLNETATTDVSSFVSAYKCNAEYNEDNSALAPNDALSVCVVSEAPNEVNVKDLVSMTAIQNEANLGIVQNGDAVINSITEIDFFARGVKVTTRLPPNVFTFADGQSVTIQGQVEMELANGGARKLRVLVDAGIEGDEKASYDLEVNLQEGEGVAADGLSAMGNSAIAAVALDKAFAFAATLVFVFAA